LGLLRGYGLFTSRRYDRVLSRFPLSLSTSPISWETRICGRRLKCASTSISNKRALSFGVIRT
jgi:hypothetical protein